MYVYNVNALLTFYIKNGFWAALRSKYHSKSSPNYEQDMNIK